MDLTKIVSLSGKPGLYKVTGQGKQSVVVESLIDGKRFPAFSHDRMSSLQEISMYTQNGDRPLKEIFRAIHDKVGGEIGFDPKKASNDELKTIFAGFVPDYDADAVYASDIRKVFVWYVLLMEKELLDFSEEPEVISSETDEAVGEAEA
ncbi:MAG: DUF5606 domain-containing protein [Bacteroidales bacterium]|nr:DUF5606 domain-containing protein [Bacteroidales bacterium]